MQVFKSTGALGKKVGLLTMKFSWLTSWSYCNFILSITHLPCQVSEVNLMRKFKQRDTCRHTTRQPILVETGERWSLKCIRNMNKCKTIRHGNFRFKFLFYKDRHRDSFSLQRHFTLRKIVFSYY